MISFVYNNNMRIILKLRFLFILFSMHIIFSFMCPFYLFSWYNFLTPPSILDPYLIESIKNGEKGDNQPPISKDDEILSRIQEWLARIDSTKLMDLFVSATREPHTVKKIFLKNINDPDVAKIPEQLFTDSVRIELQLRLLEEHPDQKLLEFFEEIPQVIDVHLSEKLKKNGWAMTMELPPSSLDEQDRRQRVSALKTLMQLTQYLHSIPMQQRVVRLLNLESNRRGLDRAPLRRTLQEKLGFKKPVNLPHGYFDTSIKDHIYWIMVPEQTDFEKFLNGYALQAIEVVLMPNAWTELNIVNVELNNPRPQAVSLEKDLMKRAKATEKAYMSGLRVNDQKHLIDEQTEREFLALVEKELEIREFEPPGDILKQQLEKLIASLNSLFPNHQIHNVRYIMGAP